MKPDLPSALLIGSLAAGAEACCLPAPKPSAGELFWQQFESSYYYQGDADVKTGMEQIARDLKDHSTLAESDCGPIQALPKINAFDSDQINSQSICLRNNDGRQEGWVVLTPMENDHKIHAWMHTAVPNGLWTNNTSIYCKNTDRGLPLLDVERYDVARTTRTDLHQDWVGLDSKDGHDIAVQRIAQGLANRRVWTENLTQLGVTDSTRVAAYIKTKEDCPDDSIVTQ